MSVPGVLIGRDGSVRRYVGHSNRSGELYGRVERLGGGRWSAVCDGCGHLFEDRTQHWVVLELRDHWQDCETTHPELSGGSGTNDK